MGLPRDRNQHRMASGRGQWFEWFELKELGKLMVDGHDPCHLFLFYVYIIDIYSYYHNYIKHWMCPGADHLHSILPTRTTASTTTRPTGATDENKRRTSCLNRKSPLTSHLGNLQGRG